MKRKICQRFLGDDDGQSSLALIWSIKAHVKALQGILRLYLLVMTVIPMYKVLSKRVRTDGGKECHVRLSVMVAMNALQRFEKA